MDIERLRKMAGLNESDTLGPELTKAKVERDSDGQQSPSFKGLLSQKSEGNKDFSFLKSLRNKPVEEATYGEERSEQNYLAAQEYYDDAFGLDYIKSEKGQDEICQELLSYMKNSYNSPSTEIQSIQDWVDAFETAWEQYEDAVLNEFGVDFTIEDGGFDDVYEYTELKLSQYYKKYFANEFAKWAQTHEKILTDEGFPTFPEIGAAQFGTMASPDAVKESRIKINKTGDMVNTEKFNDLNDENID